MCCERTYRRTRGKVVPCQRKERLPAVPYQHDLTLVPILVYISFFFDFILVYKRVFFREILTTRPLLEGGFSVIYFEHSFVYHISLFFLLVLFLMNLFALS